MLIATHLLENVHLLDRFSLTIKFTIVVISKATVEFMFIRMIEEQIGCRAVVTIGAKRVKQFRKNYRVQRHYKFHKMLLGK